jgi:hypothetical protein
MDNMITPGDDDTSDEDEVISVTPVDVAHMFRRVDELYTDRSYFAIADVCDLIICICFRLLRMKRKSRTGKSHSYRRELSPGQTFTSLEN